MTAAVAANYIMDDSPTSNKVMRKDGCCGSDGEMILPLVVLRSCIYGHPELHTLLSRTVSMSGETKK